MKRPKGTVPSGPKRKDFHHAILVEKYTALLLLDMCHMFHSFSDTPTNLFFATNAFNV